MINLMKASDAELNYIQSYSTILPDECLGPVYKMHQAYLRMELNYFRWKLCHSADIGKHAITIENSRKPKLPFSQIEFHNFDLQTQSGYWLVCTNEFQDANLIELLTNNADLLDWNMLRILIVVPMQVSDSRIFTKIPEWFPKIPSSNYRVVGYDCDDKVLHNLKDSAFESEFRKTIDDCRIQGYENEDISVNT